MDSNEGLMLRNIPSKAIKDALEPTNENGMGMAIPYDSAKAIRKLKKTEWSDGKQYIGGEDGLSVYFKFMPSKEANDFYQLDLADDKQATPLIANFTVGNQPYFSLYVGADAPTYNMNGWTVMDISMEWANPENDFPYAKECHITFSDATKLTFKKTKNGYKIDGIKQTEACDFPDDKGNKIIVPSMLEVCVGNDAAYGSGFTGIKIGTDDEDFWEKTEKYYADGNVTYYLEEVGELYASPDMYIGTDFEDSYLLPPELDFEDFGGLKTNQAVKFNLLIDNPTFSTNNYTGRNSRKPSSRLVESIIFPGDESLLAPLGYAENGNPADCGLDLPEGRVLKSVTPAMEKGVIISVKLEFRDGTSCIFPEPELLGFSATDKENKQILKGVIDMESLVIFSGNVNAEYEKMKDERRMRNLNRDYNIIVDDENLTRVVAWYAGERGEIMCVLVPDPENSSKSILIRIPSEG